MDEKTDVKKEIGSRIKYYRKQRGLTVEQLAEAVYKTKSTVSKYETGKISIDIASLYEIADALGVRVESLIYYKPGDSVLHNSSNVPTFFQGQSRFFMYFYDGKIKQLNRCVIDILSVDENGTSKAMLYGNIKDYFHCQNCEYIYTGEIEHSDALSNLTFISVDNPLIKVHISALAPYKKSDVKWGLLLGISSRPFMPIAAKVLITKEIQDETQEFIQSLIISKEDISLFKQYNMFPVM